MNTSGHVIIRDDMPLEHSDGGACNLMKRFVGGIKSITQVEIDQR